MIATLDRPDADDLAEVVLAWDPSAVDWRVMNDEAEAATDARTQFEVQALPFMDQLYAAAMRMTSEPRRHVIELSNGEVTTGRTVVIATGAQYRRLDVPELESLVGRWVFYGAAVAEAPSMTGQEIYVVGGGNSAGQAALHLARYARQVTLLVRGASLAASMSDYLIGQLVATRNVAIRYHAAVVGGR